MEERIKKAVAKINQLIEKGEFSLYGQDYIDMVNEYGINELMVLGCKLCETPTKIKHLEIPYHGISKRRLDKALETLKKIEENS